MPLMMMSGDNVEAAVRPATAVGAATATSNNLFGALRAAAQGGVTRLERSFSSGSPGENSSSNDDAVGSSRRRMASEPLGAGQ